MRGLVTLTGAVLLLLAGCGSQAQPAGADPLCSASYAPRELVDTAQTAVLPTTPERKPAEARTTDAAAIRKVVDAACGLPTPPQDIACTLELGPSFQLRFVDTRGRTTTLTAEGYGCQFVEGLGSRRYDAEPLWDALTAAGLPAPR
ncbi:hypothetical protein M8542_19475 [Amycolatopsis sp. OK19-0408]|uniref:DUF3558 domain-containing protein n=1 Tax=Amycolatopsis iheyensis TaxID=2945988 RepID=A0A9X2NDL0_9PSEU|nr:hypothetical protein [Amycolatopsis iheyensis]MCR6485012.1 hypothetical protein [Amycolatopsis iheyensis]